MQGALSRISGATRSHRRRSRTDGRVVKVRTACLYAQDRLARVLTEANGKGETCSLRTKREYHREASDKTQEARTPPPEGSAGQQTQETRWRQYAPTTT